MEVILPFNTQDKEHFRNSAIEIGFDEFVAVKFIYIMQDSDLDVFQLMGGERLSLLCYGWQICDARLRQLPTSNDFTSLPKSLQTVIKRLTHYSLDMWFSKEWAENRSQFKAGLLHCLRRVKGIFSSTPVMSLLDWDYLLHLEVRPWQVPYLSKFFVVVKRENVRPTECIECIEEPTSKEDLLHLKQEGLFLSLLRLIKMFDAGYMEAVKGLSMRIIATWNYLYEKAVSVTVEEQHKRCLVLICHIYLMAIYELDDARGFVIDNMMHNIRFYCQNAHTQQLQQLDCTAARYIARTCENLHLSSGDFFEAVIFDTFDESFTTLFGAVSHAYMSYVLGNMLMTMNNMNEQDFAVNVEDFKRILNFYVVERERSEQFMLQEICKQEKQCNSHNVPNTVRNMTDYKSKICKGNRMSNISHYEDGDEASSVDDKTNLSLEEKGRRFDPVFQNVPNNANILYYVYNVLAKRTFKGWHFAKLVLLLRIIGHELNVIETWRYHPGLTTDFMLNLEMKLSRHFEDLAVIFQEYPFMEQEFWLTAFYLDPKPKYFAAVNRCGVRFSHRQRQQRVGDEHMNSERLEKPERVDKNPGATLGNAKYGLLSSTMDVLEIVQMANHDTPSMDYGPLYKALYSFRLPENIIKDLLTVTFLSRNSSFAWAVNWLELRRRCKDLMKTAGRKRRLVELNMAEASDRLKFLKIDYDKYKHRPQLDYGTIEEGYESNAKYSSYNTNDELDEEEDFSEDEEEYTDFPTDATTTMKEDKNDDDFVDYFTNTRRTRARTAAIIASNTSGRDERYKKIDDDKYAPVLLPGLMRDCEERVESSHADPMCNLKDWLQEHVAYKNVTTGFQSFSDIWNFDAEELQKVEFSSAFIETNKFLNKFTTLHNAKANANERRLSHQPYEDIDENDDESDTSIIAFKGSQERIACQFDSDNVDRRASTAEDSADDNFLSPNKSFRMQKLLKSNMAVGRSEEIDDHSSDDELKKQCMNKQLQVSLRRLIVTDIDKLRQPVVRLKRLNYEAYVEQQQSKRPRVQHKAYIDSDVSNSPVHSDYSQDHSAEFRNINRYVYHSEQNSESSTESEGYKTKRRVGRPPLNKAVKAVRGRGRPRKLVVTPRSASGLKLRISKQTDTRISVESEQQSEIEPGIIDFVQIDSSLSTDPEDLTTYDVKVPLSAVEEMDEIEEPTQDPLFVEEMILPFD